MPKYDVYIAGPMTGRKNKNKKAFMEAAKYLRERGYAVVNPWEIDIAHPEPTWAASMRRDIEQLVQCSAVATLPGWGKSKGAKLEVGIMKQLGAVVQPVTYY
jgi:Domain of unknown function (DUF4406)